MSHSPPPVPSHDAEKVDPEGIYRAGTLRYTKRGLAILLLWLLWGDFAYSFFESIFGRFIPIYLNDLHASNAMVGIMTGSLAGLVNILCLPNISLWSDHYRGPRGRRIPLLLVATPLTVISLIAIGFAPEVGAWLRDSLLVHLSPAISEKTVILTLLSLSVVAFHCFNMVMVNAYTWLLRDVVPLELMARFLSWFRIVGTISSFTFLWFVFPHIITHRREIFLAIGIFYLVAFLLMCRNVKEGGYPPAAPKPARSGILQFFAGYFRDCLKIPIYRNFFIGYVLVILAASCTASFFVLFARNNLAINMDALGRIFAYGAAAAAIAYLPMGWFCDKYAPLLVTLVALVALVLISFLGWLFVANEFRFLIYSVLFAIPTVGWAMGSQATTMKLFPKEEFGKFAAGLNVFGCGGLIVGNYVIGNFMDLLNSNYRMAFLWGGIFYALAFVPILSVYRDWKRRGGLENYVAPLPN